jgi:hypothetical protein
MPDLSDAVNWSEIDANNNQTPPNGWPEGMMPSGVNDAARADKGALKRFWNKVNPVQYITPSGGVYTFMTASAAYPAAYVNGEIYCFHPTTGSVGGDHFQVNALGPKPIVKRGMPGVGGIQPIIAGDLQQNGGAQLVYYDSYAGGGGFLLLNPYVPVYGDGVGGVSIPGALAVGGALAVASGGIGVDGDIRIGTPGHPDKTIGYLTRHQQAAGNRRLGLTASDPNNVYYPLEQLWINAAVTTITSQLVADGYRSHSGIGGVYQPNLFNIQWNGTQAHLWIDNIDEGPIVTGSAGDVVIGGNISAGSISASGGITAGGAVQGENLRSIGDSYVGGNLYVQTGEVQAENLSSIGDSYIGNNLYVTGTVSASAGASIGGQANLNGGAVINNGLVIYPASGQADALFCSADAQLNGTVWVGADGAGGLVVGDPQPAIITGSVNLTAGGNYYRNGAAIPVLADALNDALRDAPEGAAMVIVKRAGELVAQAVQYDELAARVQALEAALTARTE